MFMFIDPTLGAPLLEPLLSAQDTPAYTLPYAMNDLGISARLYKVISCLREIGTSYPNVTAHNTAHTEGVGQCGNMLIMAYAHARISGDGSVVGRHVRLPDSSSRKIDPDFGDLSTHCFATGLTTLSITLSSFRRSTSLADLQVYSFDTDIQVLV